MKYRDHNIKKSFTREINLSTKSIPCKKKYKREKSNSTKYRNLQD